MTPNLPSWLQSAINEIINAQSTSDVTASSVQMSQQYRSLKPSRQTIITNQDVAAYLAARLPATYAAVSAALYQTLQRLPSFAPRTMLDIGAGPGTASFAAYEQFKSLKQFSLMDNNTPFLDVARQLIIAAPDVLRAVNITHQNIIAYQEFAQSDLIIAAYALVELPFLAQITIIKHLWAACTGVLLIVEPGTPKAYERLMLLRSELIQNGAFVVAPCTGQGKCTLIAPDWCHFVQRLPRTKAHMAAKQANVPFEDEKFSYLAVSRCESLPKIARILSPPEERKAGIRFKLCTQNGLESCLVPSRDRAEFKKVKKLKWGDEIR